jgi:hypothetical protein
MRFIWILFLIATAGMLSARADTIVVAGILVDSNGSRAGGYTVNIYAGTPGVGEASDTTSSFGVFTVVKNNVDPATLGSSGSPGSWYLVCDQGPKKAYKPLLFERRPNNIWQAKVEDLKLVSTNQAHYDLNESSNTLNTVASIAAVRVKRDPSRSAQENEMLESLAAQILGRTELGQDPEATLRGISGLLRRNHDSNLPLLPVLSENKFLLLRNRAEFTMGPP